ncbi:MAG: hypothetical protein ACK45B_14745 [Limisphaerales bacterium]
MNDPIVTEIHRHREARARRFHYDLRAMGEDLQRRQWESGRKIVGWDTKQKGMGELKRPKDARARRFATHP